MKIQNNVAENIVNTPYQRKNDEGSNEVYYSPSFKGGVDGFLGIAGSFMQFIEDNGFLASFLVQDTIGMTIPRTYTGFMRDKEVTGEYNIQEGREVFLREGLTGPLMMAVAPVTFAIAARFGKTTSVNSQLIRRFGNSLEELLSNPNFDKSLLKNKEKFQKEYFKVNIEQILANTLGKENVDSKSVDYILEQIANYQNIPAEAKLQKGFSKSKYKKSCLSNITNHINNLKLQTGSDLEYLEKVKVGSEHLNNVKAFSTRDTVDAMIKYSDDAITLNKHLENLDRSMAENIKDASIAKRIIANVSTIFATLGVLSVVPKIYAKSDVAPGAATAMKMKENQKAVDAKNEDDAEQNSEISFKGSAGKPNWLSKLGKNISKISKEKFADDLEYNGHNFTNVLMACLSLFGLLTPRGLRAYDRAQVDENGKKDLSELWEIIVRDVTSSLSVVFAVPMLTRACVTSYEKNTGFVLMQKDRSRSGIKTALDLLNPLTSTHVLSNSEISALYNNVDSQEKMLNFCKYIDKNGGDIQKIISKSESANVLFNENTINLKDIAKQPRKDKNAKIISFIENLGKDGKLDKAAIDKKIAETMRAGCKPKVNKILQFARGLNSVPGAIITVLVSPALLGLIIPKITYANTRKMQAKAEQERQQNRENKMNVAV
ncbi:MAG: hypothetical protein E7Z89_00855 [Cyanobacteria bacterium SIG28]|nr:hypothetical protein [Cyanobacteria bacterium SIG28]